MSSILHDPEQWLDDFEAASAKQQYDMTMQAIAEPIPANIVQQIDLGMTLIDVMDSLLSCNQFELLLDLINQLQQQQPEFYQKEFQFFDDFLVEYYLYKDDLPQVETSLQRFMADPAQGIDPMFKVLDYLKLYNASELAATLCRMTYKPVQNSPKVLSGAEIDLAEVLLMQAIEQAYRQVQQEESIDWEALSTVMAEYDFNTEPLLTDLHSALETEFSADSTFLAGFKQDRRRALFLLSIAFSRFMFDQKQMGFICSQTIWQSVTEFLEQQERPKKQLSNPDSYFSFQYKALDRYVAQQIGGLLSMRQAVGVGILWGVPYVYDFLLSHQIISLQIQEWAIASTKELKVQLIEGFQKSLWKYDFVHRWLPPNSLDPTAFEAEAQQFAASMQQVTPLSEEPGEGTFTSKLQQWAEDQSLSTGLSLPSDEDEDEDEFPAARQSVEPIATKWKAPKPRKSSLQEAAGLPDSKPKKSSFKSSGQKKPKKKK